MSTFTDFERLPLGHRIVKAIYLQLRGTQNRFTEDEQQDFTCYAETDDVNGAR